MSHRTAFDTANSLRYCHQILWQGPCLDRMPSRHFPPPLDSRSAFVVTDSAGQKLAYVYFEDEPGRRAATKLLSKDETRRFAANIGKLPGLLQPAKKTARPG